MSRILVICPNAWDKAALARPQVAGDHQFVFAGEELLSNPTIWDAVRFDVKRYLDELIARFRNQGIEGVIGTGDYPGCMFAAAVGEALSLRAPSLRSVVMLSHKLYSREIQQAAVPEATPLFEAIDPFDHSKDPQLGFPLFVKPVKGTMSIRAQLVRNRNELREALRFSFAERLRGQLLLRPFQQLLLQLGDGRVPAHYFVGESPLRGDQVTVEGFVQDGEVTIMGIVDSVMYPNTMSFQRFDHPSSLSSDVQQRMADVARRVVQGSGLDHSLFNIELFHDPSNGNVQVIEINPRMSYQFADLYERVDGTNTYQVQVALALGHKVRWARGGGHSKVATSFVMRRFSDAEVLHAPGEADVLEVQQRFPGAIVQKLCRTGERLSAHDQDVGSYRYCIVNLGAPNRSVLHSDYAEVEKALRFEFAE